MWRKPSLLVPVWQRTEPSTQSGHSGLFANTHARMNRIQLAVELNYDITEPGVDFVFNIHAAQTSNQMLSAECLSLSQAVATQLYTDPFSGNRYLRLRAEMGVLKVSYAVTVDLLHHSADPAQLGELPINRLTHAVMGYIYPSRYCQSDRLLNLARQEFGHLPQGYGCFQVIRDWVFRHVTFKWNSSNSTTSAIDTVTDRVGVCRDFAHLMIALCRALNIPARFGTGRDAADVAFATIFGGVRSRAPVVQSWAIDDPANGITVPNFSALALSTDQGPSYPF